MPVTLYHARDDSALQNGSYIRQWQPAGNPKPVFSLYMNGDFIDYVPELPPGLKVYTLKQARAHIPHP